MVGPPAWRRRGRLQRAGSGAISGLNRRQLIDQLLQFRRQHLVFFVAEVADELRTAVFVEDVEQLVATEPPQGIFACLLSPSDAADV